MASPAAQEPPVPIAMDTQTLFSELLERLKGLEFQRTFGALQGSFSRKQVDGKEHWYFRTSEGGRGRGEFYVGPATEDTRQLIEGYHALRGEAEDLATDLQRMASMLVIGGCASTDHASAKVVKALAASGLFRQGGVLVGTHAYVALGNLLGVRWRNGGRTQDLDFASFKTLEVAVPPMQDGVWGTLEALRMGFLPTPGLDPRTPSTSYAIRGQRLRVDLLTTASRTGPFAPVFIPRLGAAALPMPFMDYLLEGNVDGVVVNGGATLVKVPSPARYGFHKLLVSQERPVTEQAKAAKDLAQAEEILVHLLSVRPGDLELGYDRLEAKGLHKRVARTLKARLGHREELMAFLARRT
jgi:hypothetical protein